jgi:putative endonuclease
LTSKQAQEKEQQLKHWSREWKIELIEKNNLNWGDLAEDFLKPLTEKEKLVILFGKK